MYDKTLFFRDVLTALQLRPTKNRITFFLDWAKHEQRKKGVEHGFNPLNTTYKLNSDKGATPMTGSINKGFPVMSYSQGHYGVAATANTLRLPYYKNIIKGLTMDLKTPYIIEMAKDDLKKWGTVNFIKSNEKTSFILPLIVVFIIFASLYYYYYYYATNTDFARMAF